MKQITTREQTLIVNSFIRVIKTGNINNLTSIAYKYIYLASGFIAHYNLQGFREEYTNTQQLKAEIIANHHLNKWLNFRPGDNNYEYYSSKANVYTAIVKAITD